MQAVARYDGLYRQFGHGKLLNNIGDFTLGSVVQSTAYNMGRSVFARGSQPMTPAQAVADNGDADTSGLTEITGNLGAAKGSGVVLVKYDDEGRLRYFLTDRVDTKNVFINGILGGLEGHAQQAIRQLGVIGNATQFTLVHNQSHGPILDIFESALDILGITSRPASVTARLMADAESRGLTVNWVAHSQGGAILAQAMQINAFKGQSLSRQTVTFHAAAANAFFTGSLVRATGANGGSHFFNSGDLVPILTGGNGDFLQAIGSLMAPVGGTLGRRHDFPSDFEWREWRSGP